MRPDNAFYNIYYAHLDSQMVLQGQQVHTGDVIGLTGNTGNARFTASHLHFGIYTNTGAIDPLYFVKSSDNEPQKTSVALTSLNTWMRSKKSARLYLASSYNSNNSISLDENTLIRPEAGTGNFYRIILPDGKKGFMTASSVTSVIKPLKRITLKRPLLMLSSPDLMALQKRQLAVGEKINILATFNGFLFINEKDNQEGWIARNQL
jgi:murein DD-endopeptidase MepM/ murein hydrolase activator NlpD